jgi:hypothetical protein
VAGRDTYNAQDDFGSRWRGVQMSVQYSLSDLVFDKAALSGVPDTVGNNPLKIPGQFGPQKTRVGVARTQGGVAIQRVECIGERTR